MNTPVEEILKNVGQFGSLHTPIQKLCYFYSSDKGEVTVLKSGDVCILQSVLTDKIGLRFLSNDGRLMDWTWSITKDLRIISEKYSEYFRRVL